MKNPIGRPIEPNAISRNGKRFVFWLRKDEAAKLEFLASSLQETKAQIIRKLIQNYIPKE